MIMSRNFLTDLSSLGARHSKVFYKKTVHSSGNTEHINRSRILTLGSI